MASRRESAGVVALISLSAVLAGHFGVRFSHTVAAFAFLVVISSIFLVLCKCAVE